MENYLEAYRVEQGLSFAALGRKAGYSTATTFKHCKGVIRISGDAAIRYSRALGIPLDELRPDLFGAEPHPTTPTPAQRGMESRI
jgi:hypothetical protein